MYICKHFCSYMCLFLPHVLYTVWCLSKSYAHTNNCKKDLLGKKEKENTTAQIGTNVRARGFNAGLLAWSQFASGRFCDLLLAPFFHNGNLDRRQNFYAMIYTSRVPQGSVLSPTLYNLYINDTPQTYGINLALFADDTCLYAQGDFVLRKLQRGLNSMAAWCELWNIKINEDKTRTIYFSHQQRSRPSAYSLDYIPYPKVRD
jgi:hypothetical protein